MASDFSTLRTLLGRVQDLHNTANLLEWDQETYMPPGAADSRARQIATVKRLAHELATADEVRMALETAADSVDPGSADDDLVRVARRDFERATCLSGDLVERLARAEANGRTAWAEARSKDDFGLFAPHLATLVELNRKKANAYGYEEHPYDALLEQFEPGGTRQEIAGVFSDLRASLVPMVTRLSAASAAGTPEVLRREWDEKGQWAFGMAVARDMGYDFERGRQDRSAHPFTTTFSITDVRITTRLEPAYWPTGLYGTIHEVGHGLYEQGVDQALERTPLADGTSLGMHESQSRLWENMVGRSRPFFEAYFDRMVETAPSVFGSETIDSVYAAANSVSPSLIRVEADEVTYNLHIMLRFQMEVELIDGSIEVADVPARWNELMGKLLGVAPGSDANGCLQDIHWSMGAFGYFPTYALGNLMSAQLLDAILVSIPDLHEQIRQRDFEPLLSWLREHIHRWGRRRTAGQLLESVTGRPLSAEPWLRYIREKYGALYGVSLEAPPE